jgi:hypothetical protein
MKMLSTRQPAAKSTVSHRARVSSVKAENARPLKIAWRS